MGETLIRRDEWLRESFPPNEPKRCEDPDNCQELHTDTEDEWPHHYGCECQDCMVYYWRLKR